MGLEKEFNELESLARIRAMFEKFDVQHKQRETRLHDIAESDRLAREASVDPNSAQKYRISSTRRK